MRPYTPTAGTGDEAEDNSIDLDGDIVSSYKRRLYEEEVAVKLYKGETTSDGRPEDEMLVSLTSPTSHCCYTTASTICHFYYIVLFI